MKLRRGMKLRRETILRVVKCTHWQDLRFDMKGLGREEKLAMLASWLKTPSPGCVCPYADRAVQVVNYLNALSRGGLIEPIMGNTAQECLNNVVFKD